MSGIGLDAARASAQTSILQKFTAAFDRAEKLAPGAGQDPTSRKLAAARIALEYAVMKTAIEKNVPSQVVASALEGAAPEQQAMMVREGRAAMERAYGHSPDLIAGALAGKIVDVPMPKGFASNPEFDKLIDSARNGVASIVQEAYAARGRFLDAGPKSELIESASQPRTATARTELSSRLAFLDSAIDAAASRGHLGKEAAQMLKERVEAFVFQPRPPQSLSYTPEFTAYYKSAGQQMRSEVMAEVRAVTQASTISDIGKKLDQTMKALEATRPEKALER